MVRPLTERIERPSADTTPAVTVDSNPSGLPIATTSWPRRRFFELPSAAKCRFREASARSSARSVSGSTPSTRASVTPPSLSRILICFDEPTTWLLVSTSPSGEMTIPEPSPPRCRASGRVATVSTRTTAGPTRSVTPITASE